MNITARTCKHCRYWSDLIAKSDGASMSAVCLNKQSVYTNAYTGSFMSCPQWASWHLGSIDDPGIAPDAYSEDEKA